MAFQTHDVWLVNFPFSDLSTTKARPRPPSRVCVTMPRTKQKSYNFEVALNSKEVYYANDY